MRVLGVNATEDIDVVGYSFDLALCVDLAELGVSDPGDRVRTDYARRAPKFLSAALRGLDPGKVTFVPHHVAHAASAGLAAPYQQSACLVLDGRGSVQRGLEEVMLELATWLHEQATLPFETPADLAAVIAQELADDRIVAWYQGRSECGPRALGHRSLLAHPGRRENLERLNDIKGREQFRPIAPLVLADRAAEIFDGPLPSPYMLFVHDVSPAWQQRIPAIVHVDGTARIPTVDPADESLLARLLDQFELRTGLPVLISTSLNTAGRPMVDSPSGCARAVRLDACGRACHRPSCRTAGGSVPLSGLTIVIPTIGRSCLTNLIADLASQQLYEATICVVDDCLDPDRPLTCAHRVLRSGGRGPAAARNVGWRAADTEWIAFLDDDVRLPEGWLSALYDDLRRVDVQVQRGNADDALMRAVHGRRRRALAECPSGRLEWHVATVLCAASAVLITRKATAIWVLLTADFARRRIMPGPRTSDEVIRMAVTSAVLPFAAVWHRARGTWRHRGSKAWTGNVSAVLFDRDGTLIQDVPYNGDPDQVHPVPQAHEALRRLKRAGLAVGVITNQSGIGRHLITAEEVAAVNRRIDELLGPFDTWQVCPHSEADGCACRKPAAGLVLAAAADLGVPPSHVVVIGDIGSDVAAAEAAGARSVLVPNEKTRADEVRAARIVRPDLLAAVDHVLENGRRR